MRGCRPLSEEEIASVVSALSRSRYPERNIALFILGVRSGFRVTELLSLTVGDVMQHGRMVDRLDVARKNMKGAIQGRSVPLHADGRRALTALLQEMGDTPPSAPLFKSQRGTRAISRGQAWEILERAYAECNLTGKLGTHSMRKSFAARVYDRLGRDLIKTQRALGHKSVNSTVSYLSFADSEVDDAILA